MSTLTLVIILAILGNIVFIFLYNIAVISTSEPEYKFDKDTNLLTLYIDVNGKYSNLKEEYIFKLEDNSFIYQKNISEAIIESLVISVIGTPMLAYIFWNYFGNTFNWKFILCSIGVFVILYLLGTVLALENTWYAKKYIQDNEKDILKK